MMICQHCGAEIAAQPTLGGMTVWAATVPVGAWAAPFDCVAVGGAAAHRP